MSVTILELELEGRDKGCQSFSLSFSGSDVVLVASTANSTGFKDSTKHQIMFKQKLKASRAYTAARSCPVASKPPPSYTSTPPLLRMVKTLSANPTGLVTAAADPLSGFSVRVVAVVWEICLERWGGRWVWSWKREEGECWIGAELQTIGNVLVCNLQPINQSIGTSN